MSDSGDIITSTLYKDNEEWKDVEPIFPSKEEEDAVKIAVSPEFRDAYAYFRAVLKSNEKSDRVLQLTEDCIRLNPANYTVWQYRRDCLKELGKDMKNELKYLDDVIQETPKNYQVWHHRRAILTCLGEDSAAGELDFTSDVILDENKNYHAWQHRQWVVRTFNLPMEPEMSFSLRLLLEDPRNNSVYNYRYFLITINDKLEDKEVIDIEINLAKRFIEGMPNNESAWNYLTGLLLPNGILSNKGVIHFAEDLYENTAPEKRSSFLVAFIADTLLEKIEKQEDEQQSADRAKQLYTDLITIDPVRVNYYKHQRLLVDQLVLKNKPKRVVQ